MSFTFEQLKVSVSYAVNHAAQQAGKAVEFKEVGEEFWVVLER
ncbi:MAG TPA: hypothetical protein PKZ84_21100 [Anaerolineae bacterium]|nr:hypothetical protein [Anaerolineae bacterium]HQI85269.1 hypothetical protein [Anaerolineae bacterium]